jgi:hypothetical protein
MPPPTQRKVVLALDCRFWARYKNLSSWAIPHGDYVGYLSVFDSFPWQSVVLLEDGQPHSENAVQQAAFRPSYSGDGDYYHVYDACVASSLPSAYCHDCKGIVGDLIA